MESSVFKEHMRTVRDELFSTDSADNAPIGGIFGPDFPDLLDRIERAGIERNESEATWLCSLTQFDEHDRVGRNILLAGMALTALELMPAAALRTAIQTLANLPSAPSAYRLIGLCKVFAASGSAETVPFLEQIGCLGGEGLHREVTSAIRKIQETVTRQDVSPDGKYEFDGE